MSLTRKEWEEMWEAIEKIQDAYDNNAIFPHSGYRGSVRIAIKTIKKLIQQVIGQME